MKRIIAVRHAKTKEGEAGQKDFDRKLTDRGKIDAEAVGRIIFGEGIGIDLFVSSPAKRARKTCKIFVEQYNRSKEEIIFDESLYNAPASAYFGVIESLDNNRDSAAIFGHNPGITDFVNMLYPNKFTEMPTCGVFAAEADVDDWKDFEKADKRFLFFEAPRMTQ